jgi:hypothetical protein
VPCLDDGAGGAVTRDLRGNDERCETVATASSAAASSYRSSNSVRSGGARKINQGVQLHCIIESLLLINNNYSEISNKLLVQLNPMTICQLRH